LCREATFRTATAVVSQAWAGEIASRLSTFFKVIFWSEMVEATQIASFSILALGWYCIEAILPEENGQFKSPADASSR